MTKDFKAIPSPTIIWRERMIEDLEDEDLTFSEHKFNEEILQQTDVLLSAFVKGMGNIDGQKFPEEIKRKVIDLVEELNKLGGMEGEMGNFIETGEREDLCDFIDEVITLTGYELREFEDLTEDYREW